MQGSKSDFFQKQSKKQKHWDDGTGKKQDSRKFNSGNQKRRSHQQDY